MESRAVLEEKLAKLEEQFKNTEDIPRPESWGGYILITNYFEFWQGRASRLHDRIIYKADGDNWAIHRIAP